MPRTAPVVELSKEEHQQLEAVLRRRSAGQLEVMRARMLLAASQGELNKAIARRLAVREATVSKIRKRFAAERLGALHDAPRSGRKPKYDAATEERVLAALDAPRPKGYARWNGRLVAEHLGDVKAHHVWRVLRRRGISLERRRSWRLLPAAKCAPSLEKMFVSTQITPCLAQTFCVARSSGVVTTTNSSK